MPADPRGASPDPFVVDGRERGFFVVARHHVVHARDGALAWRSGTSPCPRPDRPRGAGARAPIRTISEFIRRSSKVSRGSARSSGSAPVLRCASAPRARRGRSVAPAIDHSHLSAGQEALHARPGSPAPGDAGSSPCRGRGRERPLIRQLDCECLHDGSSKRGVSVPRASARTGAGAAHPHARAIARRSSMTAPATRCAVAGACTFAL